MRFGGRDWWDAVRNGIGVGGRGQGLEVVQRATLCFGNGSEGGFLL